MMREDSVVKKNDVKRRFGTLFEVRIYLVQDGPKMPEETREVEKERKETIQTLSLQV